MTSPFLKDICSGFSIERKENLVLIKMKRVPPIELPLHPTEEIAYLTGVLVGDGNLTITKRVKLSKYPSTKIRIYNSSREYLEKINSMFKSSLKTEGRIYKKPDKNCWVLEIYRKAIWIYFVDIIGLVPKRKFFLDLPSIVDTEALLKYFLAGLFDTDGYFSKTFGIMMNGSNYSFLQKIKNSTKKYYNLSFNGPYKNELKVNDRIYHRTSILLSQKDVAGFKEIIPLKLKG